MALRASILTRTALSPEEGSFSLLRWKTSMRSADPRQSNVQYYMKDTNPRVERNSCHPF